MSSTLHNEMEEDIWAEARCVRPRKNEKELLGQEEMGLKYFNSGREMQGTKSSSRIQTCPAPPRENPALPFSHSQVNLFSFQSKPSDFQKGILWGNVKRPQGRVCPAPFFSLPPVTPAQPSISTQLIPWPFQSQDRPPLPPHSN